MLGLGVSGGGVGVARFFAKAGAHVTVVDKKSKKELSDSVRALRTYKSISYIFGRHPSRIERFDIVVLNPKVDLRSPIVRNIKILAQKKILRIESEAGLFLKQCKGKIIAVTGTKGKGTTASLIYTMLKRGKRDVLLGGNIGVSLLDMLPRIKKGTYVVFETSSFQLDLLRLAGERPHFFASVLTNIYSDHLDRYDSFGGYKKSKLSIFTYPATHRIDGRKVSGRLPKWIDAKKIKLLGEHNKKNIALATRAALSARVAKKDIAGAVYSFRGLPYRLEYIGNKKGVMFYNDSYSTTPDSTIAALKSLQTSQSSPERGRGTAKRVILIVGGVSKGVSFSGFAKETKKRAKTVILFGKSARAIKRSFIGSPTSDLGSRTSLEIFVMRTLKEACAKALQQAERGDIILFSPACASFDQFRNARERGELFKKLVGGK